MAVVKLATNWDAIYIPNSVSLSLQMIKSIMKRVNVTHTRAQGSVCKLQYSPVVLACCMAVILGLSEGGGGYVEGEKGLWRWIRGLAGTVRPPFTVIWPCITQHRDPVNWRTIFRHNKLHWDWTIMSQMTSVSLNKSWPGIKNRTIKTKPQKTCRLTSKIRKLNTVPTNWEDI